MAMIEMSSVLVKRACEEKLEKIGFVKGRLKEYIDMSIYNIQIFGKDMQRIEAEEQSVKLILKMSEISDTVFMDEKDFKLLEGCV